MAEYQWARGNGEVITADYDRSKDTLTSGEVCSELLAAFRQFGHTASCGAVSGQLPEVYTVSVKDVGDITVCAKETTPGGRHNLKDEQRTQQKSNYINYAFRQRQAGHTAVQLGVYKRDGQTVFCAWKLKESLADPLSPISKQIKITTIAQAMKEGFAQQEKDGGEYVCAFRKEFIYFYIQHEKWLHDAPVKDLNEYSEPLPDVPADDNEEAFREWFEALRKENGETYTQKTCRTYIRAVKAVPSKFEDMLAPYTSVFQITDADEYDRIIGAIKSDAQYEEFNRAHGTGAVSPCLDLYRRFLLEGAERREPVVFATGLVSGYPRCRILFGAPGTGKSFALNQEKDALLEKGGEYERVTFHPDYSYANFVGTYKPVPCRNSSGEDAITYSYVPGPFMRVYVKALLNGRTGDPKPFLLVIEEINRANAAAVFGDVFQLLDRNGSGVSEYPIQASDDMKTYLSKELGGRPADYAEICIPDNMFIWATMNSADQGVYPMDTAFKRRWNFTYIGVDDCEAKIAGKKVVLGQNEYRCTVEWNTLRKAINDELLTYKVNEDKLMGPFFISRKDLPEDGAADSAAFRRVFKNKVLMYLFDDAARQKRPSLFSGCNEKVRNQYSKICREFDAKGIYIFCDAVKDRVINSASEDTGA